MNLPPGPFPPREAELELRDNGDSRKVVPPSRGEKGDGGLGRLPRRSERP